MKIVFMGTPDFAAGALKALLAAGHEVTAAVTQPDKPKGRSGEPVCTPVKALAQEAGIPVMQPVRIKAPEAVAELREYPADIYIVAAFGQILSQEILDIPRLGCLNIHASLLPGYRGASPIQHVIIDGRRETGITVMQMDAGLDTGDMLYKKSIPIEDDDNYETLHDKLMVLGGEAITEALALLEQGKLVPEKQDDAQSCYAPLIKKELGRLDFTKPAVVLDRLIRGVTPWPSAYTFYRGRQLKIWRAVPTALPEPFVTGQTVKEGFAASGHPDGQGVTPCGGSHAPEPGEILKVEKDAVTVATGEGALRILELQLEGKRRMPAQDFLRGVKLQPGEVLGKQEL